METKIKKGQKRIVDVKYIVSWNMYKKFYYGEEEKELAIAELKKLHEKYPLSTHYMKREITTSVTYEIEDIPF